MKDTFNFISNNTGIFILCVGLITLIITLTKLVSKKLKLKLKITGDSKYIGLNPLEKIGKIN